MPEHRCQFSPQFKAEAVRMLIETGRPIAEVARDPGIRDATPGNWVTAWQREHPEPGQPVSRGNRTSAREGTPGGEPQAPESGTGRFHRPLRVVPCALPAVGQAGRPDPSQWLAAAGAATSGHQPRASNGAATLKGAILIRGERCLLRLDALADVGSVAYGGAAGWATAAGRERVLLAQFTGARRVPYPPEDGVIALPA
jgi:transposase